MVPSFLQPPVKHNKYINTLQKNAPLIRKKLRKKKEKKRKEKHRPVKVAPHTFFIDWQLQKGPFIVMRGIEIFYIPSTTLSPCRRNASNASIRFSRRGSALLVRCLLLLLSTGGTKSGCFVDGTSKSASRWRVEDVGIECGTVEIYLQMTLNPQTQRRRPRRVGLAISILRSPHKPLHRRTDGRNR
jgi:hypothetical protein